jgi:gluconate:H+ symporter, GntP family
MSPLLLLLVGMIIVIGGILLLRLHAFLALLLGALTVAGLTTNDQLLAHKLSGAAVPILAVNAQGLTVRPGKDQLLAPGANRLLVAGRLLEPTVELALLPNDPADHGRRLVRIVGAPPPGLELSHGALIHATAVTQAVKEAKAGTGERVAAAFGRTAAGVGIIIALAAIIGQSLMQSGAADRVVLAMHRLLGDARAGPGFVASGFLLCIPMFFETVFYLLLPLGKAMRRRTGRNYVLYVLSIVAGATMAHALVPPTPGPLLVAAELNVNIGLMMLGGTVVGLISASGGYLYACWANRRWDIPLPAADGADAAAAEPDAATLPPLWLSLLPILLPVLLIAGAAVAKMAIEPPLPAWAGALLFWGDKHLALSLSAAVALGTLAWKRRSSRRDLAATTQIAVTNAGGIILIIAAGGAFGGALQDTGIAEALAGYLPAAKAALIPLAFLITSIVRIAQGSATVAMITSVGIIAPLAASGDLGYHPLYLALAIGCGSKPIPWMNDSGFWMIGRMSGFTEGETFKTASVMMSLMGVVGLIATMLGAWLLPLN